MYLMVRTKNDADITSGVRNELTKLDPAVALFDVATLDERVAESLKLRRFLAFVLNAFAALGVVLAGIGLYGSLSYLVQLKKHDIGVRLALGATSQQAIRFVVLEAALLTVSGLAIGTVCATFVSLLLRNELFGVTVSDPVTWTATVGLLAITALAAGSLPALRATRIRPIEMLRQE